MNETTIGQSQLTTRGILLLMLVLGGVFGLYRAAVELNSMPLFFVGIGLLFGVQVLVVERLRRFLQPYPTWWFVIPVLAAALFMSLAAFAILTALRGF